MKTTNTLDCLDTIARVHALYDEVTRACGIKDAPELFPGELGYRPEVGGLAAVYIAPNHEILIDLDYAESRNDAVIRGTLAHELAHAQAGVAFKHSPRFQWFENENIGLIRSAGLEAVQAAPQGGTIPAGDWRSWLWLISTTGGAFALVVFAAIYGLTRMNHGV